MQEFWVEKLFDGRQFQFNVEVAILKNQIKRVTPVVGESKLPLLPGVLVPGFIDIQVNGGGGLLFNQSPKPKTLETMVAMHRTFGTTNMLPTLITSDWSTMEAAASAVSKYLAQGKPGVLGIHFEGPHLNPSRAGIHNPDKIQPLTEQHMALYCRKDLGQVVITVAPEMVSNEQIVELSRRGVTVCLGHSEADCDQVLEAIDAGARGITHLYNAMSPLASRAPGMVGAAMASDQVTAGLIVDGHHVHPVAARAAIRAKGAHRICLVTDAMGHVGARHSSLPFEGTTITNRQGKLTTPEGTLAGSALTMVEAVRNARDLLGISLSECLQMASRTPACWLGLEQRLGVIAPGFNADMALFDEDFQVTHVWQSGVPLDLRLSA